MLFAAIVGAPLVVPPPAGAQTTCAVAGDSAFTLDALLGLTERCAPAVRAARASLRSAEAAIASARALPNPEVEVMPSRFTPRPGAAPRGGGGVSTSLTQRLELPLVRSARVGVAQSGREATGADVVAIEQEIGATVRLRWFDLLRRLEELQAARDDLTLVQQIRDRVRVAVQQGEAPRFDGLRAENEVVIATRQEERARVRVEEARALLRQVVGPALPEAFAVRGDYFARGTDPDSVQLEALVRERNPAVRRAEAEQRRAARQLSLERGLRWPVIGLRAMSEREPEQRILRAGATVALPLWDRRRAPVREAQAQLERRTAEAEQSRFERARAFEVAWQQYRAAAQGVALLEGAALDDARTAVRIAEAAWRAGERGILELLDARRQLRTVRTELIAAQYDLHAARTELDLLAATLSFPSPADAR